MFAVASTSGPHPLASTLNPYFYSNLLSPKTPHTHTRWLHTHGDSRTNFCNTLCNSNIWTAAVLYYCFVFVRACEMSFVRCELTLRDSETFAHDWDCHAFWLFALDSTGRAFRSWRNKPTPTSKVVRRQAETANNLFSIFASGSETISPHPPTRSPSLTTFVPIFRWFSVRPPRMQAHAPV
jgi:hypothetical protein